MKKFHKIVPEGTKDFLLEETTARRYVEETLSQVYKNTGYSEVVTPAIEFFDVFVAGSTGGLCENMYKLVDSKGRLIVMRPDCTAPIARLTATRLKDELLPIRLYYNQKIYRSSPSLSGKSHEIKQVGIELLGADGKKGDLEAIILAIDSVSRLVPNFRFELGHANFFKALSANLPTDEETIEEVRNLIESKNYAVLNKILDSLEDCEEVRAVRKLPRMFGGEEIFEQAMDMCKSSKKDLGIENTIQYLRELYLDLIKAGYGDKIIVDFGMVHQNEYYTDVIFRAYTQGSGDSIISGGRYNQLLQNFGVDYGAIGFAINVDELTEIILSQGIISKPEPPQVLVHSEQSFEIEGLAHLQKLLASGISCVHSTFDDIESAKAYARSKGIKRIDVISDIIKIINL